MLGLDLAVRFFLLLGLLERTHLVLGQDQPVLRHFRRQRLQPLLERLQIVPQPDRAHPGWRHRERPFLQLIGDPHLAVGRLLQRKLDHRLLDLRIGPILQIRLAARNLRQRRFPAGLVELLEAIEAVATEAQHLARFGHAAQRLRQLQQPKLVLE